MNLTRSELGEKIGCAAVTIKKIERDERKPSRQMAALLAEQLMVPRSDRDLFMRMAREPYGFSPESQGEGLRIPSFLQQGERNPYQSNAGFVERHKELSRLETCLQKALAGNAMPVFLLGDAGSGKTSLMREFARIAQEAHPKLLIAGGQCNAQTGPGDPFRPFRDILGILTGDLEIDWTVGMLNRDQALQIWASIPDVIEAITNAGPHLFDTLLPVTPLVHRISPYLGGKTDWFDRFQESAYGEPSTRLGVQQGQVLEELTQVLRAVARNSPLLLILDDLQWADDASLNLLYHLGRRLTGSRVLLLGSYRTGEKGKWQQRAQPDAREAETPENLILEMARQYGDIQIKLDQASRSEGRAFIDAILDLEPNRLGEAFREDLYLHTRGHPLFTIELIRSMRQNRNLTLNSSGSWVEDSSSPPAPPPARVEAVIEQRLAALNPLQRELLNVASVEGQGFTAEIVANVLGLEWATALESFTHDLEQQDHLIQEQGVLRVRSLSLNRFQFHHMLIQEYLYSRLIPGEKRRLHRRLAEELEKALSEPEPKTIIHAEYLDAFGPALLHHSLLGEEWTRAAVYAYELGKRARQRYAMREAIAYYEQALLSLSSQAQPEEELIFDVLLGWEDAAFNFKPYEDQMVQLTRAEEIARRLHDEPRLVQALHWIANVLLAEGRWTQAGSALTESLSMAEELGNEQLSVRPIYFKALITSFADPAEALKWIGLAEELSHKHNDLQIEAVALATEANVRAQLGEFDGSQQAIERARQVSDGLGSPLVASDVDLFAAWACLAMGNREQALEFGQRSVDVAIATDNMDCICNGLACIGYTNLELGRIAEAAAAFEKGIERSDISGAMIPKLNGQAGLAMTQFMSGHPEAIRDLEDVIVTMRLYENHVGAASANHMLGTCFIQLGELERASSCLNQAVEFYRQSKMHPFLARALTSLAELRDRQGQGAEARNFRAEAESFRSMSSKT
jgi:tetratricopeptide (TPR) repeat protein/transcriptional regulator with XRE-family HTH domain